MSFGTIIISVRSTDESLDKVRDTTFEILGKVQGKPRQNTITRRNACVCGRGRLFYTNLVNELGADGTETKAELEKTLRGVNELYTSLDGTLDRSLIGHISMRIST